jgi:hypothetical protein
MHQPNPKKNAIVGLKQAKPAKKNTKTQTANPKQPNYREVFIYNSSLYITFVIIYFTNKNIK